MGASKSKAFPIGFEEANGRIHEEVRKRIEETFRRLSSSSGYLPQTTFTRDILGEFVPIKLAEAMYEAFSGTSKGMIYRDLLCGVVLLANGNNNEKAKFLTQMISEDGESVKKDHLESLITACDMLPSQVNTDGLFIQDGRQCSVEHFEKWVMEHPHLSSFTRWLLDETATTGFQLVGDPDPPSFYKTLADKFEVEEKDIMDLEKTYWSLKGTGKFDEDTFSQYVSPPLPAEICGDLFRVVDINGDGHIDLSEMISCVARICRHQGKADDLWFSVFDQDCDNLLSRAELTRAIELFLSAKKLNNVDEQEDTSISAEEVAESAIVNYQNSFVSYLTLAEYAEWCKTTDLSQELTKLMFDICHLRFGLRPQSQSDEAKVVRGCLLRFTRNGKKPGDIVYLISAEWFRQWKDYSGYQDGISVASPEVNSGGGHKKGKKKKKKNKHHHAESEVERGEEVTVEADGIEMTSTETDSFSIIEGTSIKPPLIDNSVLCDSASLNSNKKYPSLTNEGGRLDKNRPLIEGNEFVLLPELVWKVFVSWYGTVGYNSLALPRTVMPDSSVELYPVSFKIYRHTTAPPPLKGSLLPWPLASFLGSLGFLNNAPQPNTPTPILASAGDTSGQPPIPRRVACYQAAFDKPTTVAQMSQRIEQMLHVKGEDLRLYDLSNEESPQLLEDETNTVDQLEFSDGQKILVEVRNKDNSWPEEIISILNEVKAKDKQKSDIPNQEVHVPEGATGLSNLGNTCFMNSAVQCVSNTQPLTRYFREKDHLLEINKDNPLGMGGVMAKRYGDLIQDLWAGSAKSITPLKFRFTVGRCAPHFNGFQQQDAQELLAFVLDGLHEDLNRVKDKAYKELKDSDGRPDEVVADEAWQYHLSRNQSIIVDLFHGQLRSVVTCKECDHTSVRFDPFTFLSLPLPMESTVNLEIVVVRLDGSQPVRYGVKLELDDKYRQLKTALSELCAVEPLRLRLVEVYGAMIRNLPSDSTKIRSVLGGCLYAYEIPPPLPVPPTSRSDSPDEVQRKHKLKELQRQRTLSMNVIAKEKDMAAKVREKIKQQQSQNLHTDDHGDTTDAVDHLHNDTTDTVDHGDTTSMVDHDEVADTVDHSDTTDTVDRSETADTVDHDETADTVDTTDTTNGDTADMSDTAEVDDHRELPDSRQFEDTDEHSNHSVHQSGGHGQEDRDGFVFAVHRRLFSVDHYITAHQKNRPILFSTPLVVPCVGSTPRRALYESVWTQVKRLIIPDPPNKSQVESSEYKFPFELKYIGRDCMTCSLCPWYRFCRGCVIPCDGEKVGTTSGYVAVDWELTALQLKYQSAQERPVDHESMESLKIIDTKPIDLYECFKAFVRQDELGDEESWYCKQCKKHQSATKSLEIWRLPPILIIHLKRFQFVNGRWIKSQRPVTFPINHLNPRRYTVQNGNGSTEDEDHVINGGVASDSPGSVKDNASPPTKRARIDEQQPEENDDQLECKEDIPAPTLIPTHLPRIYNLFAISCHSGVLGGGHYTSFAKNSNGRWYYFNDSSCKETTEERVNEESPYMLFYELEGLDQFYDKFRATKRGNRQDIGRTEDDREFEETLKNLRKSCSIQ